MSAKLVIGLDLGINNVGWAAVQKGENEVTILAQGTYVFDSPLADESKPGEGLKTKVRGEQRRARRTGQRRRERKVGLYRLLAEHGFVPRKMNDRVELFCRNKDKLTGTEINPYALRAAALKRELSPFELGRVLCHLNQHRGFMSPRDLMAQGAFQTEDRPELSGDESEKDAEEARGLKLEIEMTRAHLQGFPTIGCYLYERQKLGEPVRKRTLQSALKAATKGKSGAELKEIEKEFKSREKLEAQRRFVRPDRQMIRDEFEAVIKAQSPYHPILTPDLIERIRKQIFDQRLLATNKSSRGNCTFFKKELRAPRASLSSQRFVIAQELAQLEIISNSQSEGSKNFITGSGTSTGSESTMSRRLTCDELNTLLKYLMTGEDLTWSKARELLGLSAQDIFSREPAKYQIIENGKRKTVTQRSGTKDKLRGSQTVSRIKAVIGEKWDQIGPEAQNDIVGEIVSIRDWVGQANSQPAAIRRRNLFLSKSYGPSRITFTEKEANELATIPLPEGYLQLSNRAIGKIMPFLTTTKKGEVVSADGEIIELVGPMVYSSAMLCAGFNHSEPDGPPVVLDQLPYPSEEDIPHALVRTSVRSAVRVLNALHRRYGKPDAIHIELPRELAQGAKQREEDEKRQRENANLRTRIAKDLIAIGIKPTGSNIQKVQLWEELGGGALPYEPDIIIPDLNALFKGEVEIEHIVPRSHALDSRLSNLTLATRTFNTQVKGNRTLWEAIGRSDPERWQRISAHIRSIRSISQHKRNAMLAKERPEGFTDRHLRATGYISSEVRKLAEKLVLKKHNVLVVSGSATGMLRKEWGLSDLVPLHPEEQAKVDEFKAFLDAIEDGTADPAKMPKFTAGAKHRSNYKHHSLDALVVALTDRASLQTLTTFAQLVENHDPRLADKTERKRLKAMALPDPELRHKAESALAQAVVVRRPNRRPTGELHKQQPVEGVLDSVPNGEPWSSKVVGKHLVRFDQNGTPSQAYPLGNNHHLVIWERTAPNAEGKTGRFAEVVPMIEAFGRKARNISVVNKVHPDPDVRYVMSLCKGDMVELEDGTFASVSKFSMEQAEGVANLVLWHVYVANQIGKINRENPYLMRSIRSKNDLELIRARVVMNPLGEIVYREGDIS